MALINISGVGPQVNSFFEAGKRKQDLDQQATKRTHLQANAYKTKDLTRIHPSE
jgi:hypothetical protein